MEYDGGTHQFFGYMHPHPSTLIYTPLPNYKWIHNTAQIYMWRNRLDHVKLRSNWAVLPRLSTLKGRRSFLENDIFHPSLTHFLSQTGPFSWFLGP